MKLRGEKVFLAEVSQRDAQKLHEYCKEPELNRYSGPYKAAESLEKAREYIKESKNGESYIFGIYERQTNELVGTIGFFDLNQKEKSGELGFWTAKPFWNKGYMTEAVRLMTYYIFKVLNYRKIYAYYDKSNKGVERVLSKAGYNKEETKTSNSFYICQY
jgi:RimJ/RimL family protein N-acetyltransferase